MMNGGPTDNNSKLFKQGYNESGDFAVSKKVDGRRLGGRWPTRTCRTGTTSRR